MGSTRPRYQIVRGMRMPLGFPAAAIASGLDYRPADGDIFVASYPKSGTTWLQYIVYMLVRQRRIGPNESLTALFPHLEEVGAEGVARQPSPRLIKTHLAFPLTPFHAGARYLVIARNPFDCAVSFYHHTRGFVQHYDFADGVFSDYLDCFVRGEVDFGDYFAHLAGWYAERQRDNVCFLTYEGLKADPAATIGRIAAFLAGGRSPACGAADIAAIIDETSIDSMRSEQQRWSSQRPAWATDFVRRGVVGDWPSLFTPALAARLLAECERRDAGHICEALWPSVARAARAFVGGSAGEPADDANRDSAGESANEPVNEPA
jgi:hypothetical protein